MQSVKRPNSISLSFGARDFQGCISDLFALCLSDSLTCFLGFAKLELSRQSRERQRQRERERESTWALRDSTSLLRIFREQSGAYSTQVLI